MADAPPPRITIFSRRVASTMRLASSLPAPSSRLSLRRGGPEFRALIQAEIEVGPEGQLRRERPRSQPQVLSYAHALRVRNSDAVLARQDAPAAKSCDATECLN